MICGSSWPLSMSRRSSPGERGHENEPAPVRKRPRPRYCQKIRWSGFLTPGSAGRARRAEAQDAPNHCHSLVRAIMRIERTISAARLPVRGGLAMRGLRGLLLAAAGLLAACGHAGSPQHPLVTHATPKVHARPAVDPAAKALEGMVEAVGPSGRQPPVELKFSIRDRPQVGKEDEVDYALIPQAAGLGSIRLVFGSVGEGLRVVSHGPALAAVKPMSGVPIFGSVTVQPVKAGLFTLTAAVAVESSTESVVVWPFTIPVIAGEGPAQTAANRP